MRSSSKRALCHGNTKKNGGMYAPIDVEIAIPNQIAQQKDTANYQNLQLYTLSIAHLDT